MPRPTRQPCSNGCQRTSVARGLCDPCYRKARKTDDGRTCSACSAAGVIARGLCEPCYRMLVARGTTERLRHKHERCGVDGCASKPYAKGWCRNHYKTFRKWGDPLAGYMPVRDRVAEVVKVRDRSTGCWEDWQFSRCSDGKRPAVVVNGSKIAAARYVRYLEDGEWPESACHTCDNEKCWNPDHIYAGTPKTNMADLKARGPAATRQ